MGVLDEKRRSIRVPVDITAKFIHGDKPQEGRILNLSIEGVLFSSPVMLDAGDLIHLSFAVPGSYQEIDVASTVAWSGYQDGTTRSFGAGVHFEDLAPSQREMIEQFIRNLLKI